MGQKISRIKKEIHAHNSIEGIKLLTVLNKTLIHIFDFILIPSLSVCHILEKVRLTFFQFPAAQFCDPIPTVVSDSCS